MTWLPSWEEVVFTWAVSLSAVRLGPWSCDRELMEMRIIQSASWGRGHFLSHYHSRPLPISYVPSLAEKGHWGSGENMMCSELAHTGSVKSHMFGVLHLHGSDLENLSGLISGSHSTLLL